MQTPRSQGLKLLNPANLGIFQVKKKSIKMHKIIKKMSCFLGLPELFSFVKIYKNELKFFKFSSNLKNLSIYQILIFLKLF